MIENGKICVEINECTKCKMCINVCPYELYTIEENQLILKPEFEEMCIECGHCVAICPVNIIRLKVHSNETLKDLPKKEALATYQELLNLAQTRRSIRKYKEKIIPKELIESILDMARYAPTGHNEENVCYTVVQDPEVLKKFSDEITDNIINFVKKYEDPEGKASLKASLPENVMKRAEGALEGFKRNIGRISRGINPWTRDTQLIIIHSPRSAATLVENCSLAAAYIMLTAESLGLATCSLGYTTAMINQFRSVGKIVKIPIRHTVAYTIAIGYPNIKYKRIPARKPAKVKWL